MAYIERERPANQSKRSLSRATGIPSTTLALIISNAEEGGNSMLGMVADKYGFSFHIYSDWRDKNPHRKKKILDVVKETYNYKYK